MRRKRKRYTNTAKKHAIFFMDGIRKKLIGNLYKQRILRVLNLHTQLVSLELTIPPSTLLLRKNKEGGIILARKEDWDN